MKLDNSLPCITSQQTFARLQHVFRVIIFHLPRCFQDVFKTSCRRLQNKKLLRWRRLEEMSWRRLEDMSWRRLLSCRQTKCLLGISVSSKSKCVSNKSIFHKPISDESKANPKCNNFEPNNFDVCRILKLKQQFYLNLWWLFGVVKSAEFKFEIAEQVRQ